jgi:hypothetical protein
MVVRYITLYANEGGRSMVDFIYLFAIGMIILGIIEIVGNVYDLIKVR